MGRPSAKPPGAVWRLLAQWADEHPLEPNQRQIANLLDVSTSLLSSWKYCESMIQSDDMLKLSQRTEIPYDQVAAAAAEDIPRVLEHIEARRGKSQGQAKRRAQDEAGEVSQDDGGMDPA